MIFGLSKFSDKKTYVFPFWRDSGPPPNAYKKLYFFYDFWSKTMNFIIVFMIWVTLTAQKDYLERFARTPFTRKCFIVKNEYFDCSAREIIDNNYVYGSEHEFVDNNRYAYGSWHELTDNNNYFYGSGHELLDNNIILMARVTNSLKIIMISRARQ